MIKTGDELAELLKRAQQIEDSYESVGQWEAYVRTKDHEFRKMIFQMLSESAKHKQMVGELIKMVKVTDHWDITPLAATRFDFTGREQLEVMDELYQAEMLMFDTYSLIRGSIDSADLDKFLVPGTKDQFSSMLKELISDEGRHASMVSSHRGKMVRIR